MRVVLFLSPIVSPTVAQRHSASLLPCPPSALQRLGLSLRHLVNALAEFESFGISACKARQSIQNETTSDGVYLVAYSVNT
jgi:hypothetical protein